MQRHLIGIIALLLLAAAVVVVVLRGDELWQGAFVRVGLLTAAVWLAYPQLQHVGRLPGWLAAGVGLVLVVVIAFVLRRPQAIAMFLGIVVLLIKLRPWAMAADRGNRPPPKRKRKPHARV